MRATPKPTWPATGASGRRSWSAGKRRNGTSCSPGRADGTTWISTIERLDHAVAALDAFRLAGLSPLVTIGGSLVAGLAVVEKAITPEVAWQAVSIDERWQLEQWGDDAEGAAAMENRRRDFFAAACFLQLLD